MKVKLLNNPMLETQSELTADYIQHLADQVSSAFLDAVHARYRREAITRLCEIATSEDGDLSKLGCKAIFSLVETFSDAFKPEYVAMYDQMFAQIIDLVRHLPAGNTVHVMLNRFGLRREQDLLDRKRKIKALPFLCSSPTKSKKIFVLSRVTLGAEVAVTSVILKRMKRTFPGAEVVLLGPRRVEELFGGDAKIRVLEAPYERHGGLLGRFEAWIDLVKVLDEEKKGLRPGEYLILDPDSRLTQLGLFPVTEDEKAYYFFESRSFRKPGVERISQLTAGWLHDVFGAGDAETYPYVKPRPEDMHVGEEVCGSLRLGGAQHIVTVNFGVGDNARKRISDSFEIQLLLHLLNEGSVIVLDKGVEEEADRANRIIGELRERGRKVIEITHGTTLKGEWGKEICCDVLAWQGGVGVFSALIASSDLYIGYDSAFQHVAAALAVPGIDIFADVRNPLFIQRWQPHGKGLVKIVKVDPRHLGENEKCIEKVLGQVVACYREIKVSPTKPAGV